MDLKKQTNVLEKLSRKEGSATLHFSLLFMYTLIKHLYINAWVILFVVCFKYNSVMMSQTWSPFDPEDPSSPAGPG